jgi:general L-amino acid transport system permease protein
MTAIDLPLRKIALSSFWTDRRFRGIFFQVLALAALFGFLAYIVDNTINNLELLGLETGYGFLNEPANYDINQRLIEYNSRSTHARAALVGVLNTALVAACGIFLATLIGFAAGVLRLSSNLLVNKLVYCYVELTRNVPVLLQILLWHAVIVHSLPRPRRALEPVAGTYLSNRGLVIPRPEFEGEIWTVIAAAMAALAGAIWFARYARRLQATTGKRYPVFSINAGLVIGLPLVAFILAGMPMTLEWPELQGFNFRGGLTIRPEFMALWLALSFYRGAFIAENVRAGIQSVSHGQTEAAYALGLKPSWTTRLIILPQALRVIVPPLISHYMNLTKDSSLAIAVGYMDIVATIGGISLNQTGRALECMSIVIGIYLTLSLSISAFMNWYNKRVALIER